jgi:hypothetical protein
VLTTSVSLGDLLDPALQEISLDVRAVDALGLSRHPHDLAELVQRSFAVRGK